MNAFPKLVRVRMIRKLLIVVCLAVLAGCGFHPRGAMVLPEDMGPLRVVSSDPYSPLAESLSEAMTRAGAMPADPTLTTGVTTLEIHSERWGDIPIAIDQQGRALEFSLKYAVVFSMRDTLDREVIPQQVVELSRDYVAPPADAIGRSSERDLLAKELRREMSASILRRIDTVSKRARAVEAAPN